LSVVIVANPNYRKPKSVEFPMNKPTKKSSQTLRSNKRKAKRKALRRSNRKRATGL
jgi:hypothetical protein